MASSEDAFRKFAMWKKSRTVLSLTVFTNFGMPDIWLGSITSVDEQQELVEFADDATRDLRTLDLRGASFAIAERSVEVMRASEESRIVFKEGLVS
jgi:hypothetical protein